MVVEIEHLSEQEAVKLADELFELLRDGVDGGASIGYLAPLAAAEGRAYLSGVAAAVGAGEKDLWLARVDGEPAGMVQLAYEQRPNGRHRAEVQKLVVHSRFRRRGIGRRLMAALEEEARRRRLRLLFLDTAEADVAQALYRQLGYELAGSIPQYALNSNGNYDATLFFYKLL